jgi:hypothetical protein
VADAVQIAAKFNEALLTLSPTQFGTKAKPNYVWHSLIGIGANTPMESPWFPKAPLQSSICSSAYSSGDGYQMLSIATGGLRYPVCDGAGFQTVFRAIAGDVVKSSGVQCRFSVPEPPAGKYVDLKTIQVEYTPGSGGAAETLHQVKANACTDNAFVVDGSDVVLCDDACTRVRLDTTAELKVRYECGEKPPDEPE